MGDVISYGAALRAHFHRRQPNYQIQVEDAIGGRALLLEVLVLPRDINIARDTQTHRSFGFQLNLWKSHGENFHDLCERIEAAIASMDPLVNFAMLRRAQGRMVRRYGYEQTAVALDAVMTMAQYRPLADDMEN